MSVATALAASTAVSAGTSAYSASRQKKAGQAAATGQSAATRAQLNYEQRRASERMAALRKLMNEGAFAFPSVNAGAAADESLGVTTRNLPGVLANTASAYDAAAANFERWLRSSYGTDSEGKPAYESQQKAVNHTVLEQLKGRLAPGTRTMLGRRALATGATSLGRGAVQDAHTYQLGLAAEDQVQRGIAGYTRLYEQYGRFAPQISPLDLLQYGGLGTNAALQNAQFNATGQWGAQLAGAGALLGGFDQETAAVGRLIGPAAAAPYNSQAVSALGSANVATQMGDIFASALGTYTGWKIMQDPSSLYGGAFRPTRLPGAEATYNRSNGIQDYSATNYFLRATRALEGAGAAFGSSSRNSLLGEMRELFQVR